MGLWINHHSENISKWKDTVSCQQRHWLYGNIGLGPRSIYPLCQPQKLVQSRSSTHKEIGPITTIDLKSKTFRGKTWDIHNISGSSTQLFFFARMVSMWCSLPKSTLLAKKVKLSFFFIFLFLPPQLYENVLRRWESQGSECQMSKLWRFLKVSKSISDIHQKIFGNIKWGFWTFINNFKTFINPWKCPFWSMKAKETTSLRHLQEKAFNQSRRRRKLFHVFSPKSEIKIVFISKIWN